MFLVIVIIIRIVLRTITTMLTNIQKDFERLVGLKPVRRLAYLCSSMMLQYNDLRRWNAAQFSELILTRNS